MRKAELEGALAHAQEELAKAKNDLSFAKSEISAYKDVIFELHSEVHTLKSTMHSQAEACREKDKEINRLNGDALAKDQMRRQQFAPELSKLTYLEKDLDLARKTNVGLENALALAEAKLEATKDVIRIQSGREA